MDTFKYLSDTNYQAYYLKYVAKRDERVLLGSDDGFLYSFNYEDGNLAWGWMPNSLVKELKDYSTFQSNEYMRGQIDVLDLKVLVKLKPGSHVYFYEQVLDGKFYEQDSRTFQ